MINSNNKLSMYFVAFVQLISFSIGKPFKFKYHYFCVNAIAFVYAVCVLSSDWLTWFK